MEIQQLRHLLAAVHYGNILEAADEVSMSQSGLSRSIKSLEDRLGVPLLLRKPKGVEPTTYGDCVIRRARLILNEVERAIQEVRAIEEARTGEVRFGVTQDYSSCLPDIMSGLAIDRPDLNMEIISGSFAGLLDQVKSEALDFGIGSIGAIRHDEGVVVEMLSDQRPSVVARASHPLVGGNPLSIADLTSARWALLNSEAVQHCFADFFERHGHPVPVQAVRADSLTLVRRIALVCDVLTVLPLEAVSKEIGQGVLVEVECPVPVDHGQIGLFFRNGGALTPQAQLLADRFRLAFAGSNDERALRSTAEAHRAHE